MGPPSLGDVVPKCGDLNLLIGIPRVREGDWAPLHQPLAKLISFVAVFREGMFIRFIEQDPSRRRHARAGPRVTDFDCLSNARLTGYVSKYKKMIASIPRSITTVSRSIALSFIKSSPNAHLITKR